MPLADPERHDIFAGKLNTMKNRDCYLVSTDHLEDQIWFRDDADFKVGMNYVALIAAMMGIRILAFVLMSNHVHFVLEGTREEALAFITEFKRRYSKYVQRKYGIRELLRVTISVGDRRVFLQSGAPGRDPGRPAFGPGPAEGIEQLGYTPAGFLSHRRWLCRPRLLCGCPFGGAAVPDAGAAQLLPAEFFQGEAAPGRKRDALFPGSEHPDRHPGLVSFAVSEIRGGGTVPGAARGTPEATPFPVQCRCRPAVPDFGYPLWGDGPHVGCRVKRE